MPEEKISILFDVRSDSYGKDPDSASLTLRKYHKLLWSKPLPNGKELVLNNDLEGVYLYHRSDLGEYFLSSDSIIHTYFKWIRMKHIIEIISNDDMKYFYDLAHTVGGYIIFPENRVNGLNTLNQERGMNKRINDRFDLTLECIRKYFTDEKSPLYEVIDRYSDFFNLFLNFKGYCDFFLLQDLVSDDYKSIKFFIPFEGFERSSLPKNSDEYYTYMQNNIEFLRNRNKRIEDFVSTIE